MLVGLVSILNWKTRPRVSRWRNLSNSSGNKFDGMKLPNSVRPKIMSWSFLRPVGTNLWSASELNIRQEMRPWISEYPLFRILSRTNANDLDCEFRIRDVPYISKLWGDYQTSPPFRIFDHDAHPKTCPLYYGGSSRLLESHIVSIHFSQSRWNRKKDSD